MFSQESALYGALVQWLRDHVAANIHTLSTESDLRAALDGAIRTWLFTPNAELGGFTPRDVIRGEQAGTMLFMFCPELSLLDIYDPEGLDEVWDKITQAARASSEADRAVH